MKMRRKMSRGKSKRYFSKNAVKVNKRNLRAVPMRGGFRI